MQISAAPLDLEALLPTTNLLISHGSSGVVSQSLRHGVPQLMLAEYVEQYQFALQIAAWQGGLAPGFDLSPENLRASLHAGLNDVRYRHAAQAFAKRHHAETPTHALECLVSHIEAKSSLT